MATSSGLSDVATATTKLRRTEQLRATVEPFLDFFSGPYAALNQDPQTANFAVGNPHDMPLPAYVDAVRGHLEPQGPDWFAYKLSEPQTQQAVARTLTARTGIDWDPADVAMTNGGFAALAVSMRALLEPGDEAIFLSPPWFFYEMLIVAADGVPVRVKVVPPDFDLDLAAIEAAITPRTRLLILNSPHNPSGRVYPLEDLQRLSEVLTTASQRAGRPIYLVSDEPYNRIVFDRRPFHSPAEVYPATVVCYSYGKTLLAPGMRMGYVTWASTMPDREALRDDVFLSQLATGFAFPNADLQHAIEDIEKLSVDIGALERRRDRLVPALRQMGYETTMPEGTFYVMVRTPIDDDVAFADALSRHKVLVLPGSVVELPGWLRVSLTASDEMVGRGLPGFGAALDAASR
jgi:aspartate aminotransferase